MEPVVEVGGFDAHAVAAEIFETAPPARLALWTSANPSRAIVLPGVENLEWLRDEHTQNEHNTLALGRPIGVPKSLLLCSLCNLRGQTYHVLNRPLSVQNMIGCSPANAQAAEEKRLHNPNGPAEGKCVVFTIMYRRTNSS